MFQLQSALRTPETIEPNTVLQNVDLNPVIQMIRTIWPGYTRGSREIIDGIVGIISKIRSSRAPNAAELQTALGLCAISPDIIFVNPGIFSFNLGRCPNSLKDALFQAGFKDMRLDQETARRTAELAFGSSNCPDIKHWSLRIRNPQIGTASVTPTPDLSLGTIEFAPVTVSDHTIDQRHDSAEERGAIDDGFRQLDPIGSAEEFGDFWPIEFAPATVYDHPIDLTGEGNEVRGAPDDPVAQLLANWLPDDPFQRDGCLPGASSNDNAFLGWAGE
jgi:hypothetical protein